ncbi:thioredoxin-like protein [Paraphaeosphaeria sporulosa]|uniref:Thioredoxin-like protein n=1 Tax=Paraphaeosphaeria sporulosa TaxID=1460663 RepID=A0A177BWJ8_9PLEO|nr:thioredoxin-like protein [Paraphaeosphaeria sporulosa]OAF99330.1 thioredoxin-like protein [Paraphaeosphaeria sporulosa]
MSTLGSVRVGRKAPDFRCDAVNKGVIEEVTLSTYINKDKKSWLILLFIPAAFSFVCPTEVLAFQNCLEEFRDRNCDVIFVSVDTKHSLWHWQNVPRQYGGLGHIDIALLSDANHKMSRDYGVLIEEEGVCLRGMFILDEETMVQQVTLNNLTVGRSVLEALRLLEAFQAVAKHGVLCPIDWKPSNNTNDIAATISNTLTESYEERLANLQKEFGDTVVTDLDAKHKRGSSGKDSNSSEERMKDSRQGSNATASSATPSSRKTSSTPSTRKTSADLRLSRESSLSTTLDSPKSTTKSSNDNEEPAKSSSNDAVPQIRTSATSTPSRWPFKSDRSPSAPQNTSLKPMPTPSRQDPPRMLRQYSQNTTARHARGHCTATKPPRPEPGPLTPAQTHLLPLSPRNTYESRRGSHVVLEFADPTSSPRTSPHATPGSPTVQPLYSPWLSAPARVQSPSSIATTPRPSEATLQGGTPTRLQATFEAIKKMSAGLASPSPKRAVSGGRGGAEGGKAAEGSGQGQGQRQGQVQTPGYFDVIVDAVEV